MKQVEKKAIPVVRIKKRNVKKRVTIMLPKEHCYHCGHDWHPRFRMVQRCPKCKTTYWKWTKEETITMRRKQTMNIQNKNNYDHVEFLDDQQAAKNG